jgi:hypothetical protein
MPIVNFSAVEKYKDFYGKVLIMSSVSVPSTYFARVSCLTSAFLETFYFFAYIIREKLHAVMYVNGKQ